MVPFSIIAFMSQLLKVHDCKEFSVKVSLTCAPYMCCTLYAVLFRFVRMRPVCVWLCCLWPAYVVTACGPHVLLRLVFRDQMEAVVSEAHEAGLSLGKISVGALLQVRACGVMISSE